MTLIRVKTENSSGTVHEVDINPDHVVFMNDRWVILSSGEEFNLIPESAHDIRQYHQTRKEN